VDTPVSNERTEGASWVETFAGVLVSPKETFHRLSNQDDSSASGLLGAAVCVFLVFALDGLRLTPAKELEWALVNVPAGIFVGVTLWLLLSSTLALLGACFNQPKEKLGAIYVTLGWSFAPWILMAPVFCYRELFGHAFFLLSIVPFAWTIIAQIYAIKATFELKVWQTLSLLFIVPMTFQAFAGLQMMQALYVTLSSLVS
jgi:hypothetical protein